MNCKHSYEKKGLPGVERPATTLQETARLRRITVLYGRLLKCLLSLRICIPSTVYWQVVLPDVLHSIRSLLCTSTNETPHKRFFRFHDGPRLVHPFLLKRHARSNKADPLVDKVELLQANPHYAFVHYPNGRETTVSTKHINTPRSNPAKR